MKSFEIERKFRVSSDAWRKGVRNSTRIRQAYLRADDEGSMRVRLREGRSATLTIKSKAIDLRRREFEYEIPQLDAELLFDLRKGAIVEKIRHLVPHDGMIWEVDEFLGANSGLLIAEIELESRFQSIAIPPWVGMEVTADKRFYNSALTSAPYTTWSDQSTVLA